MVNEIKGLQNAAVKSIPVGNKPQPGPHGNTDGARENTPSSQPVSEVRITATAAKLRQLEATIASQPVVDTQRVESIKRAIADGTYQVNAASTAGKMAVFENLLASATTVK